jgi:hypothetical protein
MTEKHDHRPAPVHGVQHAIAWPIPVPSGCSALTFRGAGVQTTEEFLLPGNAVLRIAAEKTGPFLLRVRRPDGSTLADVADLPNGGLAIMAIPEGGTYTIEVRAPARWGVTVVYEL